MMRNKRGEKLIQIRSREREREKTVEEKLLFIANN